VRCTVASSERRSLLASYSLSVVATYLRASTKRLDKYEIVFLVLHNRTNDVISDCRCLVKADDKNKQVTTAAKHRNLVCIVVTVFGIQLPCTYYGV